MGNDQRYEQKMMFTPGYDIHVYFKMESGMGKIFAKTIKDKTSLASNTKLPKMELPKFKGDYLEWEPFQQLFMRMIDNQTNMSGSEKLAYLKGQLEGEPKTLIQALPVSDESYEAAWNILNHEFRDKHTILKTALDNIFKEEQMNPRAIHQMKKVYVNINQTYMIIQNMNVNDALLQYMFYYALERRIDGLSMSIYENTLTEANYETMSIS
ncbi:hypothetical protein HA402_001566 [Bradysia odoriphaga]|nr:hypothetical protein HA402_001566 [Bradysia odoriphaga]